MRTTSPLIGCGRTGCRKIARWRPVLKFSALEGEKTATGKLIFPFPVCDHHRDTDVDNYITDDMWNGLEEWLYEKRKTRPDRSSLTIEFEPFQ